MGATVAALADWPSTKVPRHGPSRSPICRLPQDHHRLSGGPLDVEIVPTLAPTSGSALDGEIGVGGAAPPLRRTRTTDQILE